MPPDDKQPAPEREQTDESLRVEREKSDLALGEEPGVNAVDDTADAVINRARERADKVLAAARAQIDRLLVPPAADAQASLGIEGERAVEDQIVREERAVADETLRAERNESATRLAIEREKTDRDLARERARSDEALATRDEFLGVVSHDLRNMLNAIVGSAAFILEGMPPTAPVEQVFPHAQRIRRSGARMNRLIGDLVDVASIAAGALAVTRELGDPSDIVRESVDALQAQALASGVSLRAELAPPLIAAFDPARLLQVLVNLLSNAIKFTPAKGSVVVHVERQGESLDFVVRDTGVGIAQDKQESVFEQFMQVSKNDRRGVGLGLYISKCIVQGHGGKIWVESKPGEGSSFCFTLPCSMD